MVFLTAALAFVSVLLIMSGLRARRADPIEERLLAIKSGVRSRTSMLDRPFIERAVAPTFIAAANVLVKLLPTSWVQSISKQLIWAGEPLPLPTLLLFWTSMMAIFGVLFGVFADSLSSSPVIPVLAGGVGAFVGGFGTKFWLSAHISERFYQARKQLPDALDLMTTSVEAGLSLDSALTKVAEYQTGPLQVELSHALQDMTLGKARRQALTEMTERLPVPELVAFIQTLNQAEVTGARIGQVLRVQAEQVRVKRRQAAEAQAQRAPLLMLIPLVLFIFPSLFVVLLSPAAMTILELFGSGEVFGQ